MSIYEKARAYIDENGFDYVVIAQKANIPITAFEAILHGKQPMYAEDLKHICEALSISPETLIEQKITA